MTKIRIRWICMLFLAAGLPDPAVAAGEMPDDDGHSTARAAVSEFAGKLKAALGDALATGDLVAALDACSEQAPQIAVSASSRSGIAVGRTSERTRNPDNRPEDWQLAVLREWQADKQRGQDISGREYYAAQSDGGFMYMRPIFVQPACLACHGEIQSVRLKDALKSRYPDDRATGYRAGDLRGAFVARK